MFLSKDTIIFEKNTINTMTFQDESFLLFETCCSIRTNVPEIFI